MYIKIVPAIRIVRTDVLIAQIEFVSVAEILHNKTKIIWIRARKKKVLI